MPERWLVDARTLRSAELVPPSSKSDAQRALVLAHLLGVAPPALADVEVPADVRALAAGLAILRSRSASSIDCGDGGAPLRLLVGQAAVEPGLHSILTGSARLAERPHRALFEALRATLVPAGLVIHEAPALFPLSIVGARGIAARPRFEARAAESSQFASSLLFAAAVLASREARAWTVALVGPPASEGYLALTIDWMTRAGLSVTRDGATLVVAPARRPPTMLVVPGDWSSLGYLLPIAWRSGSTVTRVDPQAAHPDRVILSLLERAGLDVELGGGCARVTGRARAGITASGALCPDLLPTAAALACVLPAPSLLTDVAILRNKESDRLAGIAELVAAAGARLVTLPDDTLRIEPGVVPAELAIASRGDHRLAMAGATLAVLAGVRVEIEAPRVVDKSFPGFYAELAKIGVTVTPR